MKKEIATICCLVGLAVIQLLTASVSRLSTETDNIIALSLLPSLCNGGPNSSDITTGFLAEEDGEEMMDSEVHRRLILEADGKTIGYGALNRDRPICNSGPRSYANCLPPPANPRTRGCNPIYQCRN
ncbi:protein RALF-like 32 [Asparagus officinalis]|uniref:protein RALF-like 32 n=1 Tax=Asparagus officinalis TaxID=4686 RepID=UPI00098DF836|nr:protein RALF-like 32 [Asparagus officinalis]